MDRKKQKKNLEFSFLKKPVDLQGRDCSDINYDSSTLYIPDSEFNTFTSIEQQYWKIKQEYFDTVVFFQKGKFYELYEKDAVLANQLFSMKITERVQMKMCGFPISSYEIWAKKFLEEGYKIARVDQRENMIGKKLRENQNKKNKIIERSISEIITPSTSTFYENNINHIYLASIYISDKVHMALYSSIKNRIIIKSFADNKNYFNLHTVLLQYNVKEIISNNPIGKKKIIRPIHNKLLNFNLNLNDELNSNELIAYSNLIHYLIYLKKDGKNIKVIKESREEQRIYCEINNITIENLIINSDLVKRVNMCASTAGGRILRNWIYYPYYRVDKILIRQEIINLLDKVDYDDIHRKIEFIGDIERYLGRLNGLYKIIDLYNLLKSVRSALTIIQKDSHIMKLFNNITFNMNCKCTEKTINYSYDISYCEDLNNFIDRYLDIYEIQKEHIEKLQLDDKEKRLYSEYTDIKNKLDIYKKTLEVNLKIPIKYASLNKDIYQLEIDNRYLNKIPNNFILISNTKNVKRYYTDELKKIVESYKEYEELIFQNKEKILFTAVEEIRREEIFNLILKLSYTIGEIDAFISIKKFNDLNSSIESVQPKIICEYCSTIINGEKIDNIIFSAKDLTHPLFPSYISNNIEFTKKNKLALMTGPNMGGKSTLLRTIGLSSILAQCGFNVLASSFIFRPFDKIFTRLGASDNLLRGQSTFEIEMLECADILNNGTKNSLLLIDELGRGTSVKDGEAICQAVLEHIISVQKSMCIFSTHYHRMIEDILIWKKDIRILHMKYKFEDETERIIFLFKIGEGICADSQGIAVARLAGIPDEIISDAERIKKYLKK